MNRQLYILLISFVGAVSLGWGGEDDDILQILRKSSTIDTPKYPDYTIYDPFKSAIPAIKKAKKVEIKVSPPIPILSAVIDDTAFIDGKWRRVGDTVKGYKIVSIKKDGSVVLKLGQKSIDLHVTAKKQISKIKIIDRHRRR